MRSELEDKTLLYWNLSKAFNGRPDAPTIATEKALRTTRTLNHGLNPYRPLALRVRIVEHEIVYRQNLSAKPEPAKVLSLVR